MQRHGGRAALALTAILLAALLAAAPAAQARPKVPATKSTFDGKSVYTSWTVKSGTIELRVERTGAKKALATRKAAASKQLVRITLKGTPPARTALRVKARRCTGKGAKRSCSRWSGRRKVAPEMPIGSPSPSPSPQPAGPGPTIGSCPLLPAGHSLNQDVSQLPLHPNSAAYVGSIGTDRNVHPDFGAADLGQGPGGFGIPFKVVPESQPKLPVTFTEYPEESDPGPYPIPLDAAIEGGPNADGDRHTLVVQEGDCKLYELYRAFPQASSWNAEGGAVWNLRTGAPRPARWTSADAAGLPILPGLARYDEVAAGEIRHALRFTVQRSQRAYIAPASHWASSSTDPALPPMGLRLRMRADYPTANLTGQAKVVATALKRYGMIVADNGSNWYISGAPDTRWDDDDLGQLKRIPGSAFEAVDTGPIVAP